MAENLRHFHLHFYRYHYIIISIFVIMNDPKNFLDLKCSIPWPFKTTRSQAIDLAKPKRDKFLSREGQFVLLSRCVHVEWIGMGIIGCNVMLFTAMTTKHFRYWKRHIIVAFIQVIAKCKHMVEIKENFPHYKKNICNVLILPWIFFMRLGLKLGKPHIQIITE